MNYTTLLLENLDLIDRVVQFIARRHRLSSADTEEFSSVVRFKLLDRDFAVLRKFQGRSNMNTYLTTVVERAYLDFCIARWGKWRSSATARRLGPTAVHLEELLARDGLTFEEAMGVLQTNRGVTEGREALLAIAQQLPPRVARRFAGEEELAVLATQDGMPDEGQQRVADRELADRIQRALEAALATFSAEDRVILKMRYVDGVPVARIAGALGVEPSPLYRRLEQMTAVLRRHFLAQHIDATDAERVIGHPELMLGQLIENLPPAPENPSMRPSNK